MNIHSNSGSSLWRESKTIIPGGNQLLSKRSEMFLPDLWPSYYKEARGIEVWDLDDNHYFDMSIMGIGTCPLGYANEAVNSAVKTAIDKGSMSTLNCHEEVELAKKLLELHPWFHQARFARTGGEACTIAVRTARAATGKDKVAFCGYHGWHDWYISANIDDGSHLNNQLLPGLAPNGVPKVLKGTAIPFHYGQAQELRQIVDQNLNEIGVIILEVARYKTVDVDFLHEVRDIATEIGAVLIFDEITSGFRACPGGMHRLFEIKPDVAVLGKAMGNGYPIAAVVGTSDIMEAAQDTFISSTYWTERIGFTAALEVICQFEENNVGDYLVKTGKELKVRLQSMFAALSLDIEVQGLDAGPAIMIKEDDALEIKTVFTQEMLKRGYLASTLIYLSTAHNNENLDGYLQTAKEVWTTIAAAVRGDSLVSMLEGPICHSGFKRLT
ncbi:MAG: aminotransferase class III-fold pyridoxal phosphate-dependent enzyme [Candidatus Omnitrophica bacterium]|nr:aminotransferase class III-fold pyridoxal phosphate-dependent enzyme [Candidatus Omnitrophota bacterium]